MDQSVILEDANYIINGKRKNDKQPLQGCIACVKYCVKYKKNKEKFLQLMEIELKLF